VQLVSAQTKTDVNPNFRVGKTQYGGPATSVAIRVPRVHRLHGGVVPEKRPEMVAAQGGRPSASGREGQGRANPDGHRRKAAAAICGLSPVTEGRIWPPVETCLPESGATPLPARDTGRAMSQENSEIVLQQVVAANRRDADAFVALVSPDVEWEDSVFWSEPARIYRGRAKVREWLNRDLEPWESLHVEADEIAESSDGRVFSGLFLEGRGTASGVETELRAWQVAWFANAKVTRRRVFRDRDQALEVAGLRE
jgi:ketosteroid isomerase-like protein